MNKKQQKIYLSTETNMKIKQLANINRRKISTEIEIAIEEHIEKFESKFGEIPEDLRYKEKPINESTENQDSQGGGKS